MSEIQQRVHMHSQTKNTLLKVVILGDGGVGKSCLMNRFVSNHFDDHSFHTIGVEFLNKNIEVNGEPYTLQLLPCILVKPVPKFSSLRYTKPKGGVKVGHNSRNQFQIWDTAGQERFKSLRTPFYRGSDICILTYAIDDRGSFENMKTWMSEFLHYADVRDGNSSYPFVVVGNKSDVPENEREVNAEQLGKWCDNNQVAAYIETSAKNASNVQEAFALAVQRWLALERIAERELSAMVTDSIELSRMDSRTESRFSCCGGGSNQDYR